MKDMSCLAENYIVAADFDLTGVNQNEIVVGPTGCGKSVSNAYSRLLHTFDSSVVIPISKKSIKDKFAKMFIDRGYEVLDIDFAHPEKSMAGYDPFDYIHSDEDIIQTAKNFIISDTYVGKSSSTDPYWNESAVSVLAAEIAIVKINAKMRKSSPCFADVIELHRSLQVNYEGSVISTNIDYMFEQAERRYPGNQAAQLWKTVSNLAPRTASCIFSTVNNAIDKIFSKNIIALMKKKKKVSFSRLGEKKTALFITTSPMNKTLQNFVNIMYSDMFRELFETAEQKEKSRLSVPVHIVCDDFACGSRIYNFEEYISIFRAAGISTTILLQSESQLSAMYGDVAANTIINNCDTYVYMGGMDIATCKNVSTRINKPLHKVMSMPLEKVIVFRRGSEPFIGRRYQTFNDDLYKQICIDSLEKAF